MLEIWVGSPRWRILKFLDDRGPTASHVLFYHVRENVEGRNKEKARMWMRLGHLEKEGYIRRSHGETTITQAGRKALQRAVVINNEGVGAY